MVIYTLLLPTCLQPMNMGDQTAAHVVDSCGSRYIAKIITNKQFSFKKKRGFLISRNVFDKHNIFKYVIVF